MGGNANCCCIAAGEGANAGESLPATPPEMFIEEIISVYSDPPNGMGPLEVNICGCCCTGDPSCLTGTSFGYK
jgi:hypothetical protein